jgi:hypothetical protein
MSNIDKKRYLSETNIRTIEEKNNVKSQKIVLFSVKEEDKANTVFQDNEREYLKKMFLHEHDFTLFTSNGGSFLKCLTCDALYCQLCGVLVHGGLIQKRISTDPRSKQKREMIHRHHQVYERYRRVMNYNHVQ